MPKISVCKLLPTLVDEILLTAPDTPPPAIIS